MDQSAIGPGIMFFSLCALMCFFLIFKPKIVVNLTLKWFKFTHRLYGFEGEIRPTPKAIVIYRYWGIFMLFIFFISVYSFFLELRTDQRTREQRTDQVPCEEQVRNN